MNDNPTQPPQPLNTGGSKAPLWVGLGVVIVIAIGLVYFALGQRTDTAVIESEVEEVEMDDQMITTDSDSLPVNVDPIDTDPAADTSELTETEFKTFEITGRNFAYSQEEIRVNQGDTVRIVFSSTEGFHDWVIDEFNAATEQVNPGTTTTVEFVADQAGTFEYYCSVGQHRQLGMVGNLVVE